MRRSQDQKAAVVPPRQSRSPFNLYSGVTSLLVAVLLLGPASRSVSANEHDSGIWSTVSVATPLAQKWSAGMLVQTRVNNHFGDLERTVLRPSLTYKATEAFALTAGYDAHFLERRAGDRIEQRLWQQVSTGTQTGAIKWTGHARLEERFIEDVSGTGLRLRLKARAQAAIGHDTWYAAISNEYFTNLNDLNGGPQSGFDQNRFFVGIGGAVNDHIATEFGYQMQLINRLGEDVMVHQLVLSLSLK